GSASSAGSAPPTSTAGRKSTGPVCGRPAVAVPSAEGRADGGVIVETDLRAGDVVRVSCPFTATRVTGRTGSHVLIEWPWREAGLGWAECCDKVAIEADPGSSANSPGL